MGTAGSIGVLFCFGISSIACCPERLFTQPGFRRQLSGHSRYLENRRSQRRGSPHKVHVQPKLGHGNFPAYLHGHRSFAATPGGVLPAPGHFFPSAQGFVQPCGELGQGDDPVKSCAEQHQKQVLARQFPNAAEMLVLVKESFGSG